MKKRLLLLLAVPCLTFGGEAENKRFLAICDRIHVVIKKGEFYRVNTRDLHQKFSALSKVYAECKECNDEACVNFMQLANAYEDHEGNLEKQFKREFEELVKAYSKGKRHLKRIKKLTRDNKKLN